MTAFPKYAEAALDVLLELAQDGGQPPEDRRIAASMILGFTLSPMYHGSSDDDEFEQEGAP